MIDSIVTLLILIFLQAVLGIDNLLYISLESNNAPKEKQKYVRNIGISIAIALRIVLLFVFLKVIEYFQNPLFSIKENEIFTGAFNLHSLLVYIGGGFIIYTAIKEIWHMVSFNHIVKEHEKKKKSLNNIIFMIVIMNLIFSFDSILSVIAFTDIIWVMVASIIIGGLLMIWLSEKVSVFLNKHRKFEILGLFILFLVGVMLITDAAHISELKILGSVVHPMNKSTFYFLLLILILIDTLQTKYQKKLMKQEEMKNKKKLS